MIIIFSIILIIIAIRNTSKGQFMGWQYFSRLVEQLQNKEITEEEFEKKIKERG